VVLPLPVPPAVGQAQIHDGRVCVEFLTESIGNYLKAGLESTIIEADAGQ
jgi:hypothetical protein